MATAREPHLVLHGAKGLDGNLEKITAEFEVCAYALTPGGHGMETLNQQTVASMRS
jgi:hypothetical protein